MQPNGTTDAPPIAWPTVTIGGRVYVVKFNQLAEYLVSKWGYDLNELLSVIRPAEPGKPRDPRILAFILQLWAACTAHNFTTAMPPQKALTAEEWMEILPEDDPQTMGAIGTAVVAAVVKRWSDQQRKKAGLNPTTTEAPAPATPVQ